MKIKVFGIKTTIKKILKHKKMLEDKEILGLKESAEIVYNSSQALVPVHTGVLKSSGKIYINQSSKSIYVYYYAVNNGFKYDVYIHNNENINHPIHYDIKTGEYYNCGGNYKYLQAPFEANKNLLIKTISNIISK